MYQKLITLRKKHKLTCAHMAKILEISTPYYWQIENGKRNLTYPMAIKIASVLLTTPDTLFYQK